MSPLVQLLYLHARLSSRIHANLCSNPLERPTADVLLSQHPFCELDPNYNFFDTDLYAKIRGTY